MGEVYRAQDLKIGQTVALKFLPKSLSHNTEALALFTRVSIFMPWVNMCWSQIQTRFVYHAQKQLFLGSRCCVAVDERRQSRGMPCRKCSGLKSFPLNGR